MAQRTARSATATVSLAQIGFAKGFQEPLQGARSALLESMVPGAKVVRYDRTWIMAAYSIADDAFLSGEIGFQKEDAEQIVFDEDSNEFLVRPTRNGASAPFTINLETLRVVFQLRGGLIKPGTFRGNFQALLNEGRDWHWRVRLVGVEQPPWEDWVDQVTRIRTLKIHATRPNPRFPGKQVEDLFDLSKSKAIDLGLAAAEGDSLDPDGDELIRQAIELAKDYGNVRATGEQDTATGTAIVPFNQNAEGQAIKQQIPADPSSRRADPDAMRQIAEEQEDR